MIASSWKFLTVSALRIRQSTAAVVGFYALSRAWLFFTALDVLPYSPGTRIPSDVDLYNSWATVILAGHYPIGDPSWQYPPLAGFVFALGVHLLSDPVTGFMLLALAADAAIFILVLLRGRKISNIDGAWVYTIAAVAIGPIFLVRFDLFPTLCAVLALLALAKPLRSGAFIGLGALLKVWPIFLVICHPRRALPRVVAAAAAVVVVGLTLLASWGPGSLSFLDQQAGRGLQVESTGGVIYVLGQLLGFHVEVDQRFGAAEFNVAGAGAIAALIAIIGLVALAGLAFARLRGRLELVAGADIALTIVLISIASSRVFSPQYMVWVAGVAAVCLLDGTTRMRPVIALMLPLALAGQYVYPFAYGNMLHGGWYGVLVQTLRIGLLLVATGWALMRVLQPATASPVRDLDLDRRAGLSTGPR